MAFSKFEDILQGQLSLSACVYIGNQPGREQLTYVLLGTSCIVDFPRKCYTRFSFFIICLVCPMKCDAVTLLSVAICSSHSNTNRAKTHSFSTMTKVSIVLDIFMHNANYAATLLGTFPLLLVNRFYREFVNGIQSVGASFHHHGCLRRGKKDTICINKRRLAREGYPLFCCLVCCASVTRPWWDHDARQFIGYAAEAQPKFLTDVRCLGWTYAMRMANVGSHPRGIIQQKTEIGHYLAFHSTWRIKWMASFLNDAVWHTAQSCESVFRVAVMHAYNENGGTALTT